MEISSPTNVPRDERRLRPSPHRYDLIATDFLLINLSFFLASLFVYGILDYSALPGRNWVLVTFVNLSWGILAMHYEVYRWYERIRMEEQLMKVFKVLIGLLAVTSIFYFNSLGATPSNPFLISAFVASFLLVSGGRMFHRLREGDDFRHFRYVIVGGKKENLMDLFKAYNYCFPGSAHVVGRFGNTRHEGVRNIGTYHEIKPYLLGNPNIDKLIFFHSLLSVEEEREIMRICENQYIDVEVAPRDTTIFPRTYKGQRLGDLTMLTLKEEPLAILRNKILKRAFDIVFSLMVILFIFPIMLPVIAFLIYREDPGPIFFRQERTGYRNNVFRMWKFRSMYVNPATADEIQASKDDPRITKIGRILRKTSLDEFPQFINVLMGEMSVVGPRPHMMKHTTEYSRIIDTYMIRHKVKPGVTGLAQINGFRGETKEVWRMEKRVEYDVWYLENWSLLMDIRCVVVTAYQTAFNRSTGAG